jgi:hypothetical protein
LVAVAKAIRLKDNAAHHFSCDILPLPEDDLRIIIQTRLDNYELRVEEGVSSRHRCQSEPKRYVEKNDALEAKDGQFQMQWDDKDTTL